MSWQSEQRDAGAMGEFVRLRSEAEQVDCPEPNCLAEVGTTCRNLLTGEPLGKQPAHDKRIKKARG